MNTPEYWYSARMRQGFPFPHTGPYMLQGPQSMPHPPFEPNNFGREVAEVRLCLLTLGCANVSSVDKQHATLNA